ncbi:MAG: invasion associated locus B family protein [Pseudomonadota bacterium]
MRRIFGLWTFLLALLAAMSLPGGTYAQTSSAKKAPPSEAAGKPSARVAGGYGAWTMLCGTEEGQKDTEERCSLVLPLIEQKTQKLVFRLILTHGPKGRLVLRIDGPTGVALQRGLELSTESGETFRVAFQTCLPMGCKALTAVQDDLKQALLTSKKTTIQVYALNGRPIKTDADINGLQLGLDALEKKHAGLTKN